MPSACESSRTTRYASDSTTHIDLALLEPVFSLSIHVHWCRCGLVDVQSVTKQSRDHVRIQSAVGRLQESLQCTLTVHHPWPAECFNREGTLSWLTDTPYSRGGCKGFGVVNLISRFDKHIIECIIVTLGWWDEGDCNLINQHGILNSRKWTSVLKEFRDQDHESEGTLKDLADVQRACHAPQAHCLQHRIRGTKLVTVVSITHTQESPLAEIGLQVAAEIVLKEEAPVIECFAWRPVER